MKFSFWLDCCFFILKRMMNLENTLKNLNMNRCLGAIAIVAGGLSFVSSAQAAATWNANDCSVSGGTSSMGNSYSCSASSGTNNLTITAWGAPTVASTSYQAANVGKYTWSTNPLITDFGVRSVYEGSSVGSPNHAMDNSGYRQTVETKSAVNSAPDLLLLHFDTAVALGTVTLGWTQNDADFTLMAYNGSATTAAGIVDGKNAYNLAKNGNQTTSTVGTTLNTGWLLVENSGSSASSTSPLDRAVNSGSVTSSWWVISAYSSAFGGGSLDDFTDYMKLVSVGSKDVRPPDDTGSKVPEPGSLALFGAAMLAMVASKRRSTKTS